MVKNPPNNAGDIRDAGSIPGSERSPGEGNGSPLQYSGLGNPMDRGAWQATGHRVTKSRTQLSTDTVSIYKDVFPHMKTVLQKRDNSIFSSFKRKIGDQQRSEVLRTL